MEFRQNRPGKIAKYLLQHYAPGILKAAGVNQKCCIAENEEEYIEKLLNIGRNRTLRNEISRELVRGSLALFGKEMKERVVNEWEGMLYDVLKKMTQMISCIVIKINTRTSRIFFKERYNK